MHDEARQLAQVFLNSDEQSIVETFQITQHNQPTGDEIVIWVIRTNRQKSAELSETLKRYIPTASGNPCPTCGGTGRV